MAAFTGLPSLQGVLLGLTSGVMASAMCYAGAAALGVVTDGVGLLLAASCSVGTSAFVSGVSS
jgi:hypothetical protein